MKKQLLALVSLASLFVLNGCNGIGDKDTLLARINKEKVYQEDYSLLLKNRGPLKMEKGEFLYTNLYSQAALASRAVSEYPELEKEWKSYFEDLEPRLLTMVFQRYYAMENLTYSDAELRQFYDTNRRWFPGDSTGDFYMVRADVASYYYAAKNPAHFEAYLKDSLKLENPSEDDLQDAKKRFADAYRRKLQAELSGTALKDASIEVKELPSVEAKTYYDKHKDLFMTVPGYELYHVQGDSAALAAMFTETPSLEQFKAAAASKSKNPVTAKDSGYIGKVKRDYALPYGIGMVSGLAASLEDRTPGFVTPVIASDDKASFHRFYLVSLDASKLKPFDRVRAGIENGIKSGNYFDVDSSEVLITKAGKPVFTEADLNRFNRKFFHRSLNRSLHQRIVEMIAENLAYAEMARRARLQHSWEYRALYRESRWSYLGDRYLEKRMERNDISEDVLMRWHERVGSPIHVGYTYEQAKDDWRKVLSYPVNLYKHDYFMCYRVVYANKTYEQSVPAIYARNNEEYRKLLSERIAAETYLEGDVYLYDMGTAEYKPYMTAEKLLARADSLYKKGLRSEAYYAYRRLMYAYAEVDSLFEKAAYEMAQIQGENEEFDDAEGEYYAFYTMWPESPNAEKAMFSRGFMLNENLGRNEKALEVLEGFLQKYPKSELRESAEWLVNNIKSGGKLAEDLMKKIEAEE